MTNLWLESAEELPTRRHAGGNSIQRAAAHQLGNGVEAIATRIQGHLAFVAGIEQRFPAIRLSIREGRFAIGHNVVNDVRRDEWPSRKSFRLRSRAKRRQVRRRLFAQPIAM